MHIHAPVIIKTQTGFTFGVICSITTTKTAKEETTKYEAFLYHINIHADFFEEELADMEAPSTYDYGIRACVLSHPGYKWAIAESERRMNQPELPIAVESLPASINLPTT